MRNALDVAVACAMLVVLALATPLYRLALPTTLRARWLRVVQPVPYTFHSHVGPSDPRSGIIMPGLVGESYLTLCLGREGVRESIAAGAVLVTTESYTAPPDDSIYHYHRWPDQT